MLVALEGSSPTTTGINNYKYYVWKAYQEASSHRKYIEGPAALSGSTSLVSIRTMADEATAFIRQTRGPIFLIGWSRGGAACVQVALDLFRAGHGTNVEAMFLFDAVDQDTSTNDFLNDIPANVNHAYHAIATKKEGIDPLLFPTCAQNAAGEGVLVKKEFFTTHGGIVGADPENPDQGAGEWMWKHLKQHSVLDAGAPESTGVGDMAY